MKKTISFFAGLLLCLQAFSQVTKVDVQAMLDAQALTGEATIIMGTQSEQNWTFEHDKKECKINLRESAIQLIWETATDYATFMIPYSEIRYVKSRRTEAGEQYFSILIKE